MARQKIDRRGGKLKLRQIEIAPWQGQDGRTTFSVIGLGVDGAVYKFEVTSGGWVPYSMDVFVKREE